MDLKQCVKEFTAHGREINDIKISKDVVLTSSNDLTTRIWDKKNLDCVAVIDMPFAGNISSMIIINDNLYLGMYLSSI